MNNSTQVLGLHLNSTDEPTDINMYMDIFKVVFTLILVAIMFGMGCAVDHKNLFQNMKRPIGLAVGLICQIILMPVISYALVKLFNLTPVQSLALVLVGCSPGGSNSNVMTYFVKGDISLSSVAMTICSNLLALGTVPLWLFIYEAIEHMDEDLNIDYMSLAITLISIAIPITVGILFRYKFPRKSKYAPKICAGVAIVMICITLISLFAIVPMNFIFTPNTFLPATLLPLLGMAISYAITSFPAFELSRSACKAISIETGVQNVGIANSVLVLSFGDRLELFGNAITIPLIYNIAQTILLLIMVVGYRIWLCKCRSDVHEEDDFDEKDYKDKVESEKDPLRHDHNIKNIDSMDIRFLSQS